jgi:hypothetical protein
MGRYAGTALGRETAWKATGIPAPVGAGAAGGAWALV